MGPTKIVVDTREQNPWAFVGLRVVRKALKFGDYAISGRERICAVERKSGADLVASLTTGYHRLCREFCGAREAGVKLFMVCDADFDFCQATLGTYSPGRLLERTLAKFIHTTGIVPVFAGSRKTGAKIGLALLLQNSISNSC